MTVSKRFTVIAILGLYPGASLGQDAAAELRQHQQLIAAIQEQTCGSLPNNGSSQRLNLSASAEAGLEGIFSSLASAGAEVDAERETSSYVNVVQEELGNQLLNQRDCARFVLDRMWDDVARWVSEAHEAARRGGNGGSINISGDCNIGTVGSGSSTVITCTR